MNGNGVHTGHSLPLDILLNHSLIHFLPMLWCQLKLKRNITIKITKIYRNLTRLVCITHCCRHHLHSCLRASTTHSELRMTLKKKCLETKVFTEKMSIALSLARRKLRITARQHIKSNKRYDMTAFSYQTTQFVKYLGMLWNCRDRSISISLL